MCFAGSFRWRLVEVDARWAAQVANRQRAASPGRTIARAEACKRIESFAVSIEAKERVTVVIVTDAAGDGQLRGDIEVRFGEDGLIAVDAHLIGEPYRLRPVGDRNLRPKALDHIVLDDPVCLALSLKQPGDGAGSGP